MGDYFWVWISVELVVVYFCVAAFAYSRRKRPKQHRVFGKGGAMSAMKMEMIGMMSQHIVQIMAHNPMNEFKRGQFNQAWTQKIENT